MTKVLATAHLDDGLLGDLEAPGITELGSLDDDQGTEGLGLDAGAPKPILAIIYNGI